MLEAKILAISPNSSKSPSTSLFFTLLLSRSKASHNLLSFEDFKEVLKKFIKSFLLLAD